MSIPFATNDLFSDQQRAWLGGFVYGLTGIRPDLSPPVVLNPSSNTPGTVAAVEYQNPEPEYPWHDWQLPIVDRMELAKGKPIEQRLMAAMAQLDCGSCGYDCQTYSQAIAAGKESNLTLCSPGGKETKRMIKQVLKDSGTTQDSSRSLSASKPMGCSRRHPFKATLIESCPLNKLGSAKDTRHIAIDLSGSGMQYSVGDSLGVYPTNCPELTAKIVLQLSADPRQIVVSPLGSPMSLAQALLQDCCLKDPSDELLSLLVDRTACQDSQRKLQTLIDDGVPEGCDVLDVLSLAEDGSIAGAELVECLEPLNPRLYSIASSMKQVGEEVHLTVGKVTYQRGGRLRKGVASTMLAERVARGARFRVVVQPNHGGFTVPKNRSAPMIMVGPGTGIAPFRGFLQERAATGAPGKNWLFFGDQHAETDFLYQQDFEHYFNEGVLTRLDLAFSRDGGTKVYVQDRMRENASQLWQWLSDGAYFFICGDASRMAKDVHQALVEIVAEQGGMSHEEAKAYVDRLSGTGRYVRDVY
jgi:sulfite reductase (NADPH) flavoprotein alpha-component